MMHTLSTFMDWRRGICESDLPQGVRHVLLVLSLYAPTMGEAAFPSAAKLAKDTCFTVNTVRDHLREAERSGWIVRRPRFVDGRQTSNEYLLTTPLPKKRVPPPTGNSGTPPTRKTGTHVKGKGKGVCSSEEEHVRNGDLFDAEGLLPPGRIEYPERFDELWSVHARGSKKKAFEEYHRALRDKRSTHDVMLAALEAYVGSLRNGFAGTHLSNWIKDDRWNNTLPGAEPSQEDWAARELERFEQLVNGGAT